MTKRSPLTYIGVGGVALALALSACAPKAGPNDDLSGVKYTLKSATAEPEVSFATPFAASTPTAHVIETGNGDSINDGDFVLVEAAVFNGANGKVAGSTYSSEPILLPINDQLKQAAPEVYEKLKEIKVGGSFSYSTNILQQRTASGTPTASTASPGTATNVEVYTVKAKLPKYATGTAQPADPSLPSFTLDESTGKAEIKLPDTKQDVTELVSKDLIEGTGPEVKATDTIYVRYLGVQYSDGKVFDGNYEKIPAALSLQGVIKGWTAGLTGKKVGSRVELIIPADQAYGNESANGSTPTGTLVFVVDILGAEENPQTLQRAQAASAAASASALRIGFGRLHGCGHRNPGTLGYRAVNPGTLPTFSTALAAHMRWAASAPHHFESLRINQRRPPCLSASVSSTAKSPKSISPRATPPPSWSSPT